MLAIFFKLQIFLVVTNAKIRPHKTKKKNTVQDTDFAWGLGIKY
jgi:hypothetical protein